MKTENEKLIGMKKYLIEKIKALRLLFVSKSLFLVNKNPKYIHYDYYGKWNNGKYTCEVIKTEMTFDEIVKTIVAKF